MKILKFILRLLLLPVCLLMLVIQLVLKLGTTLTSWILSLISLVLVITGVFVIFAESTLSGVTILIAAWLVSPLGIVKIANTCTDFIAESMYKLRARLA